jgi:antibiotic biosynthesis monooxygenase (ABM) superfamily enzyme
MEERGGGGGPAGRVVLLTRLDGGRDPAAAQAQAQELVDRVGASAPAGVDVELIGPSSSDGRQVGLLASSRDLLALSQWVVGPEAAQAIQVLSDLGPTPVTISTQGATPPTEFPLSYVVTYSVPPASQPRFQQWQPKMVAAHLEAEGLIGAEYHAPIGADDHDWTVVVRFATDAALAAWKASERRIGLVDELETLVDDLEIGRAGLSWAGWFPPPPGEAPHRPKRWKQALATVLPLYPTVMLASTHLAPRLGHDGWGWPGWLVTFTVVATAVSTLTWLLMPTVTRVLRPWLLPAPDQPAGRDVAWTVAVVAAIAALVTLFGLTV